MDAPLDSGSAKCGLHRTSYVPTSNDVILSRGPKYFSSPGNKKLRSIVAAKLAEYASASNRPDKSLIITRVVDLIQQNGDFVKLDSRTKMWSRAGEALAREKTSQAFRDALHGTYKSSKESKRLRKQEQGLSPQAEKHMQILPNDIELSQKRLKPDSDDERGFGYISHSTHEKAENMRLETASPFSFLRYHCITTNQKPAMHSVSLSPLEDRSSSARMSVTEELFNDDELESICFDGISSILSDIDSLCPEAISPFYDMTSNN